MSKVLVDRDRVVESMCLTWRHDFGLDKLEGCDFCSGMTDKERDHMRGQIGKLFDHHFAPALSAVTAERDRLLQELAKSETNTMALMVKHFAGSMSSREQDRKLDECLSEGIAMLEAERDRLAGELSESRVDASYYAARNEQLRAEADLLRKDAERWRYVRLQGDDTHWLNLLRVDLEDFGGNVDAAVDALIDGDSTAMAAKEA